MKIVCLILLLASCFVTNALAHPDHTILEFDDAVSEAQFTIGQLIDNKTLPETWQTAKPNLEKSGVQLIQGKRRWILIYENQQEKDPSKKVIKVFLTPLGKFISFEFINQ